MASPRCRRWALGGSTASSLERWTSPGSAPNSQAISRGPTDNALACRTSGNITQVVLIQRGRRQRPRAADLSPDPYKWANSTNPEGSTPAPSRSGPYSGPVQFKQVVLIQGVVDASALAQRTTPRTRTNGHGGPYQTPSRGGPRPGRASLSVLIQGFVNLRPRAADLPPDPYK